MLIGSYLESWTIDKMDHRVITVQSDALFCFLPCPESVCACHSGTRSRLNYLFPLQHYINLSKSCSKSAIWFSFNWALVVATSGLMDRARLVFIRLSRHWPPAPSTVIWNQPSGRSTVRKRAETSWCSQHCFHYPVRRLDWAPEATQVVRHYQNVQWQRSSVHGHRW